jgi:serine protease Do
VARAASKSIDVARQIFYSLLLVGIGFVVGFAPTGRLRPNGSALAQTPAASLTTASSPAQSAAAPSQPAAAPAARSLAAGPDFTEIAAHTVDAVTNISSLEPSQRTASPFEGDPVFRYLFGNRDVFGDDRPSLSLGSGVVVSPDGYVLTNVHVLGSLVRGTQVKVALSDKRELRAQIIGADPFTDIALVKINARNLPTIPWGDSGKLKVAEWVLAIGNPYQLSQTVTLGIVSALRRSNIGAAGYEDFIQTDAAINPGNSGGALVNARGELVGINTAIYSQSGGYQGIGFAVPSNLARKVMDDLIRYGEVKRGYLGYFETIPLTSDLASQLGVDRTRGIVVSRMERTSAVYQAGLRPGDVILAFNNVALDDGSQLQRLIADARVGSIVTLRVLRANRTVSIEVPVTQAVNRRVSNSY